jgi:hypothetical protein
MNDLGSTLVRSDQLLAASYSAVKRHPRLVAFPLILFGTGMLLALGFVVAFIFRSTGHGLSDLAHWRDWLYGTGAATPARPIPFGGAGYLGFAGAYLAFMLITTFLNVALYSQIIKALGGESVSVSDGLRFGLKRIRSILFLSLLAGTVGLILQELERRLHWFGKLGSFLFGTVWSVASVFAIPIIVREEDPNPLTLIRNSATTIRKTWGDGLVGFVRIGIFSTLLFVVSTAVFVTIRVFVWHTPYDALIPFFTVIFLLIIMASFCVSNLANAIFCCALYIYATEGVVPEPYTAELLDAAWRVKK